MQVWDAGFEAHVQNMLRSDQNVVQYQQLQRCLRLASALSIERCENAQGIAQQLARFNEMQVLNWQQTQYVDFIGLLDQLSLERSVRAIRETDQFQLAAKRVVSSFYLRKTSFRPETFARPLQTVALPEFAVRSQAVLIRVTADKSEEAQRVEAAKKARADVAREAEQKAAEDERDETGLFVNPDADARGRAP